MYEQHNLPKKNTLLINILIILGILLGIYLLAWLLYVLQTKIDVGILSIGFFIAVLMAGYLFLSSRDAEYVYTLADEKLTLEKKLSGHTTLKLQIPLKAISSVAPASPSQKGKYMLGHGYEKFICIYSTDGQQQQVFFSPDSRLLHLLENRNGTDAYIERNASEILQKLSDLIKIPSVKGAPLPGAPFGQPAADALKYVLELCSSLGMRTANLDGYCGYAEVGSGEQQLGVLTHLDVVPAGECWSQPPFGGVMEQDKLYGRGALDNKGPAIASVFALAAVMNSGFHFQKRVRLIFGCDEESGWECMKHYEACEKLPDMAFTPDAEYPVIITEKGICHVHLMTNLEEGAYRLQISGGERENIVPSVAKAVVQGNIDRLYPTLMNYDNHSKNITFSVQENTLEIVSNGSAAHASTPEKGINAFFELFKFLLALNLGGDQGKFIQTVCTLFVDQYYGEGIKGLHISDTESGPLTLNLGLCYVGVNDSFPTMKPENASLDLDIRYPVTASLETVINSLQIVLPDNWDIEVTHHQAPHAVDADHILVRTLLSVYRKYTGKTSAPIAIGGGTYARTIPLAVAFGPIFEGQPSAVHNKDEYITAQDFIKNAQIFAAAIARLAGNTEK